VYDFGTRRRQSGRRVVPGGVVGKALQTYARFKRQLEKLFILGKCDLIPGGRHLKRHLRAQTSFSSNIGVDKL